MYTLKNPLENIVAIIDDTQDCTIGTFYNIAGTLRQKLGIHFFNQGEDVETVDWDFSYNEQKLTLHYSIFHGVSIFPHHKKDLHKENSVTLEVAHFLVQHGY